MDHSIRSFIIELMGVQYVARLQYKVLEAIEVKSKKTLMELSVAAGSGSLSLKELVIILGDVLAENNQGFERGVISKAIEAEGWLKPMQAANKFLTWALQGPQDEPGQPSQVAAGATEKK